MLKRLNSLLVLFGIDIPQSWRSLSEIPSFLKARRQFAQLGAASNGEFPAGKLYPCLGDRADAGGMARGHYFHQDLLVARRIFDRKPRRHADIGSRIDGFVAHVAVFREIDVFDIRPLKAKVNNIHFRQLDLTRPIDEELKGAYDSVSCLHTIEHFGLGRYGDTLDYYGHLKGVESLAQLLSPGGILHLSVPMGPQRTEFNAHRVFSLPHLLDVCRPRFNVVSFSYVSDSGELFENMEIDGADALRSYDCHYGLAILELVKT
jgi:hypothetical protein